MQAVNNTEGFYIKHLMTSSTSPQYAIACQDIGFKTMKKAQAVFISEILLSEVRGSWHYSVLCTGLHKLGKQTVNPVKVQCVCKSEAIAQIKM